MRYLDFKGSNIGALESEAYKTPKENLFERFSFGADGGSRTHTPYGTRF